MTNLIRPEALDLMLTGQLDWLTDDFQAALMSAAYTFDADHANVDDIAAAIVVRSLDFTGKTVSGGVADAADTVVTPGAGETITALWIYRVGASDALSELIAYVDTDDSGAAIEVVTDGGDLTIQWSELTNKVLRI